MKYINATILLPDELVKELQEYIQGGYIYIYMFLQFMSNANVGGSYLVIERN